MNSSVGDAATKNVVFVIYNGVTMVDFIGATEVFYMVPGMQVHWIAPAMDAILTSEKMQVLPTGTFDTAPDTIEILFIPGGYADGVNNTMFDTGYQDFIKTAAQRAVWTGSVCTGAFILAATGMLTNCAVTTYWSQLDNLKLLQDKYNITVAPGYPRFLVDPVNKRFTGGGISSSIDLALKLTEQIFDTPTAEQAQLSIQYAPGPPVQAGDPSEAPPEITMEVLAGEGDYSEKMRESVERLLHEKEPPPPSSVN